MKKLYYVPLIIIGIILVLLLTVKKAPASKTKIVFGAALALGKRIYLHCEDEQVFLPTEKTCAFYHHESIIHFACRIDELVGHLDVAMISNEKVY